jgi:TPR repeat protein
MINLAVIYDLGLGTPPDPVKSTEWLRQAAETNYSAAQYDYGLALLRGHGVPRDETLGREWIAKAAAQGDSDALKFLRTGFDLGAPGIAGF